MTAERLGADVVRREPSAEAWFLTPSTVDGGNLARQIDAALGILREACLADPVVAPVGPGSPVPAWFADMDWFPSSGLGADAALSMLGARVVGRSVNVSSPRYAAHFLAPPIITSVVGELLVGGTNQSLDSFDQGPAAALVEGALIRLLCQEAGFGGGDGVFTSGGTLSNLMGLLLARDHTRQGAFHIVCSTATHHSVLRAGQVLGIPGDRIWALEVNGEGTMDPERVERALQAITAAGDDAGVVVTIGTTDRGAVDPVTTIAGVAARERSRGARVWVHADAAASGALVLSRRHRKLVDGLRCCDSVTVDFHKLGWQAISSSVLLVRDQADLGVIRHHADYLNPDGEPDECNLAWKSLQTTRRFDAAKLALTLLALGRDGFDDLVGRQLSGIATCAALLGEMPEIELGAVGLHTVTFRWIGKSRVAGGARDALNEELRRVLARSGLAVLGRGSTAAGTWLKIQSLNPLFENDEVEAVVRAITEVGRRLEQQGAVARAARPEPAEQVWLS